MNTSVKYYMVAFCLLLIVFGVPESFTHSTGAPAGFSGAIADDQNTCESCHIPNSNNLPLNSQVLISSELENNTHYNLGESYYIAITANSVGVTKFGFQACMENTLGEKVGELVLSETVYTQLISNGNYITHTNLGSTGSGVKTWIFNWIAPPTLQGDVTLHASVLFSNSNGLISGDEVKYSSLTFLEPVFGCTNPTAFNFSAENDVENGTCLFSLNSDILSLSYQTLTIIGSEDEELEVGINVHNNSNEALIVHSKRNTLSSDTPTNWFCWGVCYTPFVSQSFYDVEIPSVSYVDEFSGHMMSGNTPGTYPIEYCFYPEGFISDSICATVNYIVTGDVYGCTNNNAINYNELANLNDSSCVGYPEPNWSFAESYGFTHTVALNADASILVNNSPITNGDWIGVFYLVDSGLICAGYTEWAGMNTTINIQGFDSEFNQGFTENEAFIWQVWDASDGVSWLMDVEYSMLQPSQNLFEYNGFSSIVSMINISPITTQTITIPNGWSLFSSYIYTSNMSVSSIFEPIIDDLIIVKNNSGQAYLVAYNYNAIGSILPGQAYLVKTTANSEITIDGAYLKPELFPISLQQGWNMVGYLPIEPIDVQDVFHDLLDQELIIIVKDYSGNALIPEWGFNGIGSMNPGQGYQVKVNAEGVLQY